MHFGNSIKCIISTKNLNGSRAHLCTKLMHFATLKY